MHKLDFTEYRDGKMKLFNKERNEQIAIDYLKEYDSRYKNLVKSECPDFISEEDSIGVEVTVLLNSVILLVALCIGIRR